MNVTVIARFVLKVISRCADHVRLSLYRLQQHAGLTPTEGTTLVFVFGVLVLGLVVREVRERAFAVDTSSYAVLDSAIAARALQLVAAADSIHITAPSDSVAIQQRTGLKPIAAAASGGMKSRNGRPPLASIDINRAGVRELQQLPRVGPALAERIRDYRDRYGPFGAVDEIMQVAGIGRKTFEQIQPYVEPIRERIPADTLVQ